MHTKQPKLLNGVLLLFLLAMILANTGGNMYGPLMPLYLKSFNASVAQIGLFFSISAIIPLALQILGGWVSDTVGRLRAIAFGSIAGICAYTALILAPTWQWLLLAMAFQAVGGALVAPSFDAFIAEHSSQENRARVFGISQSLFMIVGVVGPVLGGWLADGYGFRLMLIIAAALYVIAAFIRIGMARGAARGEESRPQKLSFNSLKTNLGTMFGMLVAGGVVTWILITDGVRDISFSLSSNLLPIYMQDIGGLTVKQIGLVNSIFGLFMMLSTYPGGWLADKKGERVSIALGMFLTGSAVWMLVSIPAASFWLYILNWVLFGLGVGIMTPAYQSLISKAVPREIRGTAFGLFSTSLGLISLPAPWIGAQLWEKATPRFPFMITAVISFLSIIPILVKFKFPKEESPLKEKSLA
jgi:DHA1 family multidrug resistance protein-like MFS transporter